MKYQAPVFYGDQLRHERLKLNLTQDELGEILGLSGASIGLYERDERNPLPWRIREFAEFFGVDVNKFTRPIGDHNMKPTKLENEAMEGVITIIKYEGQWKNKLSMKIAQLMVTYGFTPNESKKGQEILNALSDVGIILRNEWYPVVEKITNRINEVDDLPGTAETQKLIEDVHTALVIAEKAEAQDIRNMVNEDGTDGSPLNSTDDGTDNSATDTDYVG